MNEMRQYFDSPPVDSGIQPDHWDTKLQAIADTLMHHKQEEVEDQNHEPKGVYIDFKQLK